MASNPIPQGKYKPAVRHGDFIYTAGMTPRKDGKLIKAGKITAETDLEEFREAICQAAANVLTAAQNLLQEGERIEQVMLLSVYVNAEQGFTTHAKVGDIVSEYLYEHLGDAGIGPRAALGMGTLPGNAPVEVQMVAAVGR